MREKLAHLCHEQWAGWMLHLFKKGTFNSDGTFTIDKEHTKRWMIQAGTKYSALSEHEQNSDRKEADRFLKIFNER